VVESEGATVVATAAIVVVGTAVDETSAVLGIALTAAADEVNVVVDGSEAVVAGEAVAVADAVVPTGATDVA
jgi:hypothetical protein